LRANYDVANIVLIGPCWRDRTIWLALHSCRVVCLSKLARKRNRKFSFLFPILFLNFYRRPFFCMTVFIYFSLLIVGRFVENSHPSTIKIIK